MSNKQSKPELVKVAYIRNKRNMLSSPIPYAQAQTYVTRLQEDSQNSAVRIVSTR